jgi:hypothetical protein
MNGGDNRERERETNNVISHTMGRAYRLRAQCVWVHKNVFQYFTTRQTPFCVFCARASTGLSKKKIKACPRQTEHSIAVTNNCKY